MSVEDWVVGEREHDCWRFKPIPYELRVGVTGHCDNIDADAVYEAVSRCVDHDIGRVLEGASRRPRGPHGSRRTRIDRMAEAGIEVLSLGTWAVAETVKVVVGDQIQVPVVPAGLPEPCRHRRTQLDLSVVTCLAPGSDLAAARAIVDHARQDSDRKRMLEAVLPMPVDAYASEHDRYGTREDYFGLLAYDRGKNDIHEATVIDEGLTLEVLEQDDEEVGARKRQAFRAASRYMVDASEIVIAIWDPERDVRMGGTEETIRYAVDLGRLVYWLHPKMFALDTRCIRTGAGAGWIVAKGLPVGKPPMLARDLSLDFHRLAAYNRDPAFDPCDFEKQLCDLEQRFDYEDESLPCDNMRSTLRSEVLPRLAYADLLAMRYQALDLFVRWFLPAVSTLALTMIAGQILFRPDLYPLAALELLLLLIGYASYRVSVREAWHEKRLNDRHLAEQFRSLLALGLVDERAETKAAGHPHGLPFYRPANLWFDGTFKRIKGRLRRRIEEIDPGRALWKDAVEYIASSWIDGQRIHHRNNADNASRDHKQHSLATMIGLLAISLVACAHAAGMGHFDGYVKPALDRIDLWVSFFTIVLPAWGAAYQAVISLSDSPRLAERSEQMVSLLEGAEQRVRAAKTPEELDVAVDEANGLIQLEVSEWATSMRTRTSHFHG